MAVAAEKTTAADLEASNQPSKEHTATHEMPTNNSTCHLLALPAELRLFIWEYALTQDQSIEEPSIQPSLLHTNRQIRSEATDIHYRSNSFKLVLQGDISAQASRFIRRAGRNLKNIREGDVKLVLMCSVDNWSQLVTTEGEPGTRLKELTDAERTVTWAFAWYDRQLLAEELSVLVSEKGEWSHPRAERYSKTLTKVCRSFPMLRGHEAWW